MADIGSLVVKLAAETADFREDLGKSAKALDRVFAVSQRLNGIGADQVDAAKNA